MVVRKITLLAMFGFIFVVVAACGGGARGAEA
jgi:hypothetical protein